MNTSTQQTVRLEQAPSITTAGNYFVSNYPPFAYWTPEQLSEVQQALALPPASPVVPLGLYVHIPFCRKRCHFCYFKVYTDKNKDEIARYLDAVLAELEGYADQPLLRGRKPEFVYFGGGTPSYLSPTQLEYLFTGLKQALPWDAVREVTFECEPGTLTGPKLEVLKSLGVTRLSLGIENFDDHILEINGRAHRTKEIDRCYPHARELGFNQINIDLIAGMVEETHENWKRCVQRTLELEPDSVTIYQMEVPYNTTIYKQMKAEGRLAAPVADWPTKRGWVAYAFEQLEKAGYSIGSAYTAVRDASKVKFEYRDQLWAGADLLSLGVASFGHFAGVHYQNEKDFEPYIEAIERGERPIRRGYKLRAEDRLIRELILPLKRGSISRAHYQAKFGVDVLTHFAPAWDSLRAEGVLEVAGDQIKLTRAGLLEVDRLLHAFFLPEHRGERYV